MSHPRLTLVTIVLFSFALVFALAPAAHAQEPTGSTVPTGTTVEGDAFLTGPDVIVDGNVNGDVFAVGQSVTVNGNVQGSLFMIADRATVRGNVSGSAFTLGTNVNLDSTARVEHSLYAMAVSLLTNRGSSVGRNLLTLALGAQLQGNVGRETRAIIGPLEIIRLILARVDSLRLFNSSFLAIPARAVAMNADCLAPRAMNGIGAGGIIGSRLDCLLDATMQPQAQQPTAADAQNWALNRGRDFVSLALIGLILIFLLPRVFQRWTLPLGLHPWWSGGIGVLVAVNGFLVSLLLSAAVILVGFFFQLITLQSLAVVTWILGLAGVFALFWLFIFFLLFISQIVAAYWVAAYLFKRFMPKRPVHRVVPLLAGLFVFVLLMSIPVLGALIALLASIFGIGAIVVSYLPDRILNRRAAPSAAVARA